MAKQSARNRRTSQSSRESQLQAEKLKSLTESLTDLQAKRLSALKMYQGEKIERLKEAARADELLVRLEQLQSASSICSSSPADQIGTVMTDSFIAQLRGCGLAPPVPPASLTWYCLAMADRFSGPPDLLAVLHPTAPVPDLSSSGVVDGGSRDMRTGGEASVKRRSSTVSLKSSQIPADVNEDIDSLTRKLRQLEAEAEAAKRIVHDNERLVSDLKLKLHESTSTRNALMQTVKEQRATIERLS